MAFLKALPKYQRNLIRHLVFGRDATGSDDDDGLEAWPRIPRLIAEMMHVHTITLWAPSDLPDPVNDWYHWPAGRGLVKLLLDGGIDRLRVYFSDEYSDPSDCPSDFRSRYVEPVPVVEDRYKLPAGVVLKNVNAIFEICDPERDEEERDTLESFRSDHAHMKRNNNDAFWDLWEMFWRTAKEKSLLKVG